MGTKKEWLVNTAGVVTAFFTAVKAYTKVGDICIRHNVFIVSDEIHFDLVMPGYHHTVFASISEEFAQNCIVCTAPSKTFNLAGLETSNIFIPNPDRRAQFIKEQRTINHKPRCNAMGYKACQIAYDQGEEWLKQALDVIDTNYRLVKAFLAEEFPQIQVIDLEATYLLWMDWSGLGLNYKELERINTQEAYLFMDEGYVFGEQGECFERWNLAAPTWCIKAALERMKHAYAPYLKR